MTFKLVVGWRVPTESSAASGAGHGFPARRRLNGLGLNNSQGISGCQKLSLLLFLSQSERGSGNVQEIGNLGVLVHFS